MGPCRVRAQPFYGPEANLATARAAQLGALQRLLTVLDPELAATIAHPPELESAGEHAAFDFALDWVMLLGKRQFDGQQVCDSPHLFTRAHLQLQSCTPAKLVFWFIHFPCFRLAIRQRASPNVPFLCAVLILADAVVQQRS